MRQAWAWVLCSTMMTAGCGETAPTLEASLSTADRLAVAELLAPAPTLEVGDYEWFGRYLSPGEAFRKVLRAGENPFLSSGYRRLGMVRISNSLIGRGRTIFRSEEIGDQFGLQNVLGFRSGLFAFLPEITSAVLALNGQPTTNLVITLKKDVTLGGQTLPAGTQIPTGFDVESGALLPVGVRLDGNITCALCHAAVDPGTGVLVDGPPNGDLNAALLVAAATNSAAGFARLAVDPFLPELMGGGTTVLDSDGNAVELPNPQKLEDFFDALVLAVPAGNFESSPDLLNNTVQIPNVFTFGLSAFAWDGAFSTGPFGGATAISSAVHSSEINLIAAVQKSREALGLDPEVYLGLLLQNADDPAVRLPTDAPVKPSEWLRALRPDPASAELEDQVLLPGTGDYPDAAPSNFSYNALAFSEDTFALDFAAGKFLFAPNAMAAYQASLNVPPNRSAENFNALASGAVERGAAVFAAADCQSCHPAPFYTDNRIYVVEELGGVNPARAQSRLGLQDILVAPKLYTFDTTVPVPSGARVIDVPTQGISPTPDALPTGLAGTPNGGYKSMTLRGLYLNPPYMHDGGVAVRADALTYDEDGAFTIVNPGGLGLTNTLALGILPDAAASLRAMVDRDLRAAVVSTNLADPRLVVSNLSGEGHSFWVDDEAGFTPQQQADLVAFLLALDDNPGQN